jgi:hypothetical protein
MKGLAALQFQQRMKGLAALQFRAFCDHRSPAIERGPQVFMKVAPLRIKENGFKEMITPSITGFV